MRRREKYGRLSEKDRLEIGDRIWSGQTHAEAAAAVGCSTKSIQRLLTRTGGLRTEEREELRQLRRDNKRLRMEQEILKKAAAWFARESNSIPDRGSSS